jgi:hypothetical protein
VVLAAARLRMLRSRLPTSISSTAARDGRDVGVELVTKITQRVGEAGSKSATIGLPLPVIQPNTVAGLAHPCSDPTLATCTQVGSAVASSPLLAGGQPGKVYLLGPASSPSFVVAFPPPVAIRLTGAFDVQNGTVTFSSKYKAKIKRGKLVVMLNVAASRVSVSIGGSAIKVSRGLAKAVKKHHVRTLAVATKITDSAGKTTTLSLKLNV